MFFNSIANKAAWSYGRGELPFDCASSERLTCLCRPGGIPHRKHPDLFRSLRDTTRMLGPCCLCPLIDENGPDYVEAAMYMATIGPYAGQCLISCANDACGYLGK